MGNKSAKAGLADVQKRTEERVGKVTVTGRYHRLPKKLEDDYELEPKVLGSGYNGSVHLAKSRSTGGRFAVKGFKLHGVSDEKKEELETECEIFLSMDHPHVARLTDVYESEDTLDLVMECMEGGELFHRVTERKRFNERDAAEATFQMLLAVNYIHTHGIVHRDIKLENFLYERKDTDHLKLIDFGFSKIWQPNTKMALSCGTLAYVAPEVLDKSYTSQCDLWSLGVVVFILLVGYMPFGGTESHQVQMIRKGKYNMRPEAWKRVSKEANEFIAALLVVDPEKRMNAEAAINHAWLVKKRKESNTSGEVDKATVDALVAFGQASAFRRATMQVMAWSLTNDERAKVRDAFLAMDKNKTGTITAGEFKKVLENEFHITDEEAGRAFHALDTSHDSEVHYADFLAAMLTSRIQLHDKLLKQTFRRFDTDNTGYITSEDLKKILGDSIDGAEADQLVAEVDTSHDGKIDYQEFIHYVKHPEAHPTHLEATNRVIDRQLKDDGNSKVRAKTAAEKKDTAKSGAAKQGCACSLL
mmetsp:Transcript_66089/g.125059  ORF Transcript_66089/g.125059 Transcript_66089/m.125059 type:complete len:530 (-) Transcript_66089:177-1766(-)